MSVRAVGVHHYELRTMVAIEGLDWLVSPRRNMVYVNHLALNHLGLCEQPAFRGIFTPVVVNVAVASCAVFLFIHRSMGL